MVLDPRCPVQAVDVRIVGDERQAGVPRSTVQQWAIRNGIFRQVDPSQRGQLIEDFQPTFELTETLRPLFRSTEVVNATGIAATTIVQLLGEKEKIKVIRSLGYEITTKVPDDLLISISGQIVAGPVEFSMDTDFPADGRIIGNAASPLTPIFASLMPLTLYPGDRVIFKGSQGSPDQWESKVTIWIETYDLPLRPSGL